jgi:glycine/D-amino acid oxidase-like deaminating enzyme
VRHTAHGWWIEDAGLAPELPALRGEERADFLVVGGGYTGLWTAWHLLELEPEARVAMLEAEGIGTGPSGRNGGFVNSMWFSLGALCGRYGERAGLEMARAAGDSVAAVGHFCEQEEVDAWFNPAGYMQVSSAPAQDAVVAASLAACRSLGAPEAAVEMSADEIAARCRSPRFRGGAYYAAAATVHPARLAAGLRDRLRARGALLHERSRVLALSAGPGDVRARTAEGALAAGAAVIATGGGLASSGSPLRDRLTVTSSHMAITEPVPDLLDEIGWTGGECITDSRAMIHYMRTTPDGRIAFGWGGGRIACGARLRGRAELDPEAVRRVVADLVSFFPGLAGRRIEHAWGGPIDAAPRHLPAIVELPGSGVYAAFGYTGNGVGPAQMIGRSLASLALGRRDDASRLALVEPEPRRVPPEPLRWLGGTAIRRGLLAKERAEEEGRAPSLVSRAVSRVPELIGFHIGR